MASPWLPKEGSKYRLTPEHPESKCDRGRQRQNEFAALFYSVLAPMKEK